MIADIAIWALITTIGILAGLLLLGCRGFWERP